MSDEFLWAEKYRPKTIEECILPDDLKSRFLDILKTGEVPNMILTGSPGLGKTTVARALCTELDLDYMVVNCSENGNIDTLRGKIRQFASSISLMGGYKVVILDEADYLNIVSTQPALRGFIEEFSDNCRFIMTCNMINRILPALRSRCPVIAFNTSNKEKAGLAAQFYKRVEKILKDENIEFDPKSVADLIIEFAPDWRRNLGELQQFSRGGKIDPNVKSLLVDSKYDTLFKALKDKDFKAMRKWVADNMNVDPNVIMRGIFDRMEGRVKPQSIPAIVLILADYQFKHSFVADFELNMVACMTELMSEGEYL